MIADIGFDLYTLIHEQRLTILTIQLDSLQHDTKGNLHSHTNHVSQFARRLRLPFVMEINSMFAVIVHTDRDTGSQIRIINVENYEITDLVGNISLKSKDTSI